ncbi:hypothetical protein niasHT_023291 [Heterodera trifolii]|uniref:Uncharacterized protein n=1 Tax=Heterodera trifolii TaxID=157864 RepID=A0ABD2JDZ0_9BILA
MSHHQQHFPPATFKSDRRLLSAPYQSRNAERMQRRIGHGMGEHSRKFTSDGNYFCTFEGSMEVAVEIEVKETTENEGTDEANGTANSKPKMAQEKPKRQQREEEDLLLAPSLSAGEFGHHQRHFAASPIKTDELRPLPQFRHSFRHNSSLSSAAVGSLRQLLRFDPCQCFDIGEFRVRMAAAQQKIENFCSLNLDNVKLKQENGQLRQKLDKSEHRIALLEASLLERNERLKEMLKENVFMRAQFKKVQNEFGMQTLNEVFNRRG